jgi:DNA-binding GntR family transcriptional regulator
MSYEIDYGQIPKQMQMDRRSTRLRELTYQAIKDSILLGIIGVNAPLAEERLAEVLEVSRTPVREALALLEHEGLLEAIPYKGLFVKEISVKDFLEMYEAVELIEPELARRAALLAQAPEIEVMTQTLQQAEQYIPDKPGRHLMACRTFQLQLGDTAQHAYLTQLLVSIEERSDLYLISRWESLPSGNMLAAVRDRQAILSAVARHDPDAAVAAAKQHARAIRHRWRDLYTEG